MLHQINVYLYRVSMLLHIHTSWLGGVTSKMVVLLDDSYLLQLRCKEGRPIIGWNDCTSIPLHIICAKLHSAELFE